MHLLFSEEVEHSQLWACVLVYESLYESSILIQINEAVCNESIHCAFVMTCFYSFLISDVWNKLDLFIYLQMCWWFCMKFIIKKTTSNC